MLGIQASLVTVELMFVLLVRFIIVVSEAVGHFDASISLFTASDEQRQDRKKVPSPSLRNAARSKNPQIPPSSTR